MVRPGDPTRHYVYAWGNNEMRRRMQGRVCRVRARLALNTAIIEFVDNGEVSVVSRNALRRCYGTSPSRD